MYENFFGLSENPFNLTPDPRCLHLTRQAHETLEQLTQGVLARKGLILLSGKIGTGKTTLLYAALRLLEENPAVKNKIATAVIVNPTLTRDEFLEAILDDLEVPCASTSKPVRLAALLQKLLEVRGKGGAAVLVVDEAQLLSAELLEEIGLLLDLQTVDEKLLQIVLSGQPEIEEKLNRIESYHLQQQVVVHCKTTPLSFQETHDYIQHRLRVAGAKCAFVFARQAVDAVYEYSHGIPRVINLLCDHALASAYLNRVRQVSPHFIEEATVKIRFAGLELPGPRSHGVHSSDAAIAKLTALQSTPNREKVRTDEGIPQAWVAALDAISSLVAWRLPVSAIGPSNRASRGPGWISILALRQSLDRWWSFAEKRYWMLFLEAGLGGGALFTLAQRLSPLAPWQHLARMTCGYLGLLLIGVSLGLGAFLLAHECRIRSRNWTALSTIKCLLKAQIDGKLAPRIGHLREWLQAPLC